MAAGDTRTYKKATLPASGPGEIASVEITATGIIAADVAVAGISGTTRPVTGVGDSFGVYVESISTGKIVVKATKKQTPAVAVQAIVIASA